MQDKYNKENYKYFSAAEHDMLAASFGFHAALLNSFKDEKGAKELLDRMKFHEQLSKEKQ